VQCSSDSVRTSSAIHPAVSVLTRTRLFSHGILDANARKAISSLSYYVFIPALLFAQLAASLDLTRLVHWWPLCANMTVR
jgi:predicted permease